SLLQKLPPNLVMSRSVYGHHQEHKLQCSNHRDNTWFYINVKYECVYYPFKPCKITSKLKTTHRMPTGCLWPLPLADGDVKESLKPLYRHNERVEYVCQRFYTMDGNPYRTCNNGEWTGNMRCLKPCTVASESLSKHSTQEKLYLSHNDVVTFSCTVGRRPGASMNMRPACNDGEIDLPSCQ
uniref:Sushi domain-containing protein n=1 Tax=Labrus bergylta TaxID=56723 RepID=A0A3Q3EGF9_9LABR